MTSLGQGLLVFVWFGLLGTAGASGVGAWRGSAVAMRWARIGAWLTLAGVGLASGLLLWALVTDDYSLRYVATHTSRDLAIQYKVAAWWSGQAGSLLFWLFFLVIYNAYIAYVSRKSDDRLYATALAILAGLASFFGLLVTFVARPFEPAVTSVLDGSGMNPLLQNYWMMIHPVFLYLGYTSLSVPFAFAMGSLWLRQETPEWLFITRRWGLFAWLTLSIGILMGSRWAYEELGWGGYWAWDPVENASFMPWLITTAYIHSVMIQEKRGMLKRWNVTLISLAYLFTIFGTFLTRSGILASVHAFVESDIAPWFIGFIGLVTAGSLYLIMSRHSLLIDERRFEAVVSKESSFLLNNLLLIATAFAVFWGTVFPLVAGALGHSLTVGEPYFDRVTGPLFLGILALMGVGPLLAWRRASVANFKRSFIWPLVNAAFAAAYFGFLGVRSLPFLATLAACVFVCGAVLLEIVRGVSVRTQMRAEPVWLALPRLLNRNPRRYGGYAVHVAIVLIALGVVGSKVYQLERDAVLQPGQQVTVGSYTLLFQGLEVHRMGQVPEVRARFEVTRAGRSLGTLFPSKRFYPAFAMRDGPTTEVAIRSSLREDLYVVLAGWDDTDRVSAFKIYVNPLVSLLWLGGLLLIAGAGFSLWPRAAGAQVRTEQALSSLRELEYDYRMGKLSEAEYAALRPQLEQNALEALAASGKLANRGKRGDRHAQKASGDERVVEG